MSPDLDKALVKDFPTIYRDRHGDIRNTAMCWGFECGKGWEPIIRKLSEKLEAIAVEQLKLVTRNTPCSFCGRPYSLHYENSCYTKSDNPHPNCLEWKFDPPILKATQVKEKYGGLRFYTNYSYPEADKAIGQAEKESYKTCEVCGLPGKPNKDGWIRTLCPVCEQK